MTSPKISGGVTGDLPQNLVWGGYHLTVTLSPKSSLGGVTISLSWAKRGTAGQGYFPQNRQFFFARAFGARGILAIRWRGGGGAPKNEPFVRKRSWRILSVKRTHVSEVGLECKPERQNIDIHLHNRTPQSVTDKIVPNSSKILACFVSPHVKIRRALEDTHAQAQQLC